MIGDAEPEVLIGKRLHTLTGYKIWTDPELPGNERFTAPMGHLQRSSDSSGAQITLDAGLYDLDFYAQDADKARDAARKALNALVYQLPRYTWPNGLLCKSVGVPTLPFWAPATGVRRRSATYRIILHGFVQ